MDKTKGVFIPRGGPLFGGFAHFEEGNSHRLGVVCSSGCECNMCTTEKNSATVLTEK